MSFYPHCRHYSGGRLYLVLFLFLQAALVPAAAAAVAAVSVLSFSSGAQKCIRHDFCLHVGADRDHPVKLF